MKLENGELSEVLYDNNESFDNTWINRSNWWKWLIALIIFITAPVYLIIWPEDYTPIVEFLLSLFLFLMAFWIGLTKEVEGAIIKANAKWLPQAESVIYRLLTLHNNVKRFARSTQNNCDKTKCDLPELDKDEMKAVKIKMQTDCESTSQRLTDIAFQLEDAIDDWRRFIAANCTGEECSRIFDALQTRQQRLEEELKNKTEKSK